MTATAPKILIKFVGLYFVNTYLEQKKKTVLNKYHKSSSNRAGRFVSDAGALSITRQGGCHWFKGPYRELFVWNESAIEKLAHFRIAFLPYIQNN